MKVRSSRSSNMLKQSSKAEKPRPQIQNVTFPAPIRGWVLNENIAAAQPAGAMVLDNWFPTTQGLRLRGGTTKFATLSSANPVESLFVYKSGSIESFFASSGGAVFRIDNLTNTDTIPAAVLTGQTSDYYTAQPFGTAGGDYLYILNGTDDAQLFDGITWQAINDSSTPAITGVATASLSHAWSFANRLFFVEKNTMNAHYLGVDSIAGALDTFSLAGVMKRGGNLLFGATWSLDAGDGLDDKCVFVSTEGEIAVFSGTNPGNAADWRLEGIYRVGKPLGKNCTMQAGGDLLIATEQGLVPLSAAISKDYAALNLSSISAAIEPVWIKEADTRGGNPWEIVKWPAKNMLVVTQPRSSEGVAKQSLIANLETGAWSRYTGIDVRCAAIYDGRAYFGSNDGCVYILESGGSDNGQTYTGTCVWNYDHLQAPSMTKTTKMGRGTFITSDPFNAKLSTASNYSTDIPVPPATIADYAKDQWDVGLWDVALWDNSVEYPISTLWVSVPSTGYTIAPIVQITVGITPTPSIHLVSYDLTYEIGSVVN